MVKSSGPYVQGLRCRECGREYAAEPVYTCEWCFGPVEVAYDYDAIAGAVTRESIAAGPSSLWRYADLLPVHGDAAVDLHSRIDLTLEPGERASVPTGIAVAIPPGFAGLVLPRSGHAARHGIGERVELRRYAPDDELVGLYRRASVFAFLSEYEGFGMTPLEALSAGVPAVVLDTAVAREVYGSAAVFVARGDIAGTASAIRRLLTDPSSAAPVLAAAPAVLARYSWDAAADRTLEHLERVARP